jgi:hypothetical protein
MTEKARGRQSAAGMASVARIHNILLGGQGTIPQTVTPPGNCSG